MVEEESRVFKLAIAALGGQGGGVLTQWLLSAAEHSGFLAQATSVPGVAQRTGATLYYLEFFPRSAAEAADAEPVLALMPNPGDVDLVVASELMEAGRAMQRGLVTRDKTTLVTSTHRVFTIGEKSALGDGLADGETVIEVARATAKRLVALDMEAIARESGSIISSVVLGALAGSGALPFSAEACEQAIQQGGVAVERNLAAFEAGKSRAVAALDPANESAQAGSMDMIEPVAAPSNPKAKALMSRISAEFPSTCADLLGTGVHRLVDYQGHAHAGLYLDRLLKILKLDSAARQHTLLRETARGLALWMSYEDTARVADLKTRSSRFARVRAEVNAGPNQVMRIVEYLSPRVEEICGSLPAWLGGPLLKWGLTRWLVSAFTGGKKISSDRVWGYLLMRAMARTRAWRTSTIRYREEDERIRAWLATLAELAANRYELAVEFAACQQLVKGYGDTFERGLSRYLAIKNALPSIQDRKDPCSAVRELREAALAGEEGREFDAALARLCENSQPHHSEDGPGSASQEAL